MTTTAGPSLTESLTKAAHDAECLYEDFRKVYRLAEPIELTEIELWLADVVYLRGRLNRLIEARGKEHA